MMEENIKLRKIVMKEIGPKNWVTSIIIPEGQDPIPRGFKKFLSRTLDVALARHFRSTILSMKMKAKGISNDGEQ